MAFFSTTMTQYSPMQMQLKNIFFLSPFERVLSVNDPEQLAHRRPEQRHPV
jgi:hypothetical protein